MTSPSKVRRAEEQEIDGMTVSQYVDEVLLPKKTR